MIFTTSFPMFIDSLKSIRLYNWARKKNHRHINTNRVCSLKNWNCLVFCYDNPTTIDLIWLCCLFMLIFFENRRTTNKASQFQKCHKNWFPTLKKAMSGKNFFNQLKSKQNSLQTTQIQIYSNVVWVYKQIASVPDFFCQNTLYLHITYILLLLLYIIIFMHNNCNWWQEKDKKKNSWHTKQAFALNKTLSSPKNC